MTYIHDQAIAMEETGNTRELAGVSNRQAREIWELVEKNRGFFPSNPSVLDCGAGCGTFSIAAAEMLEASHVYAFEGYYRSFSSILENRRLRNTQAVLPDDHHISESTGRAVMHVQDCATNALGIGDPVLVETRSIDDLVLPVIDLIRIAVPGMAPGIIRGGASRIARDSPAIMAHVSSRKERAEVIALLEPMGYSLRSEGELSWGKGNNATVLFLSTG